MDHVTKIEWDDLHVVYVTNYYDIPLSGLCLWKGKLEKFEIEDYEYGKYRVIHMNVFQRLKARFDKKMFEWFVGTHWSYDNGRRTNYYYTRSPEWLHNAAFKFYYWWKK